jgi:molybdenum cofactor cytidylyltransferase
MNLGVAILAAGASSRMGRAKLLLPWAATTVLGNLLGQWRALAPAQLAVVVREDDAALHCELERLGESAENRIVNPTPECGMFSSVQSAARWQGWASSVTHWAVALGDQPLVRSETLRDLLEFARAHPDQVCQPSRNARGRHPVILPRVVWAQLPGATAQNLKQFLLSSGRSAARFETEDDGLDLDLDEPADYERALKRSTAERSHN